MGKKVMGCILKHWVGVLVLVVITQQAAWADGTYAGGGGTSGNPYQIATVDHYKSLMTHPEDWTGKYFIQTADLDFEGVYDIVGMGGYPSYPFTSQYDGDNFTIRNIRIGMSPNDVKNVYGLFALLQSPGIVKNLKVVNAAIVTNEKPGQSLEVGIIAARNGIYDNESGGTIQNCQGNGIVTAFYSQAPGARIGMIAGLNRGIINRCSARGSISLKTVGTNLMWVGGICGQQWGSTTLTGYTKDCTSTVTITSDPPLASLSTYVGGICGYLEDWQSSTRNYLNGCHYNGTINLSSTAPNAYLWVGGVVGRLHSDVWNCSARGTITVSAATSLAGGDADNYGALCIGGIAGVIHDTAYGCFADCAISANYNTRCYAGGAFGSARYCDLIRDCYALGSLYDLKYKSTTLCFPDGAGGFAGDAICHAIIRCWCATKPFTADLGQISKVGPFIGPSAHLKSSVFSDCFWDATTSGFTSDGTTGLTGKTTTEMQTMPTFTNYDFDFFGGRTWKGVNGMYPVLDWQTFTYGGGSGTISDPWQIKNDAQFQFMLNESSNLSANEYFRLNASVKSGYLNMMFDNHTRKVRGDLDGDGEVTSTDLAVFLETDLPTLLENLQ